MSIFIIAEAGVNHNGKLETALKLCDAAKQAGADAVKFQTWQTSKLVTHETRKAAYQSINTGDEKASQFEMLERLELGYDDFRKIQEHCRETGIMFLSTPHEKWSLDFLADDLRLPLLKIGSGDVTNIPYLRQVAAKKLPVILSTGMSTLAQVAEAYDTLVENGAPGVTLLHCTTNYPCPCDEVNLNAMLTLRDAFKCSVGYSDHTLGIEIPVAAAAIGATVIEKHFTLDKAMAGPDHRASLDPAELKAMVKAIRNVEAAMGDGVKRPNASEVEISRVVWKSIVASRDIRQGERLDSTNLTLKRSGTGLPARQWDMVEGAHARCHIPVDQPIELSDIDL